MSEEDEPILTQDSIIVETEEDANINKSVEMQELDRKIKAAWQRGDKEESRKLHERKEELRKQMLSNNKNKSKLISNEMNDTIDNNTNIEPTTNESYNENEGSNDGLSGDNDKLIEVDIGPEKHKALGDYVKSIIYGGLDGIITTFAIVAGIQGAELKTEIILVLGFANLIADGLSMGVGDYLSEKAEIDFVTSERKREEWEFDSFPDGEVQEMIDIYVEKGISRSDAKLILTTMAKYKDFFIDHMLVQELELEPVDPEANPVKNGLITLLSFLAFGCVPLVSYVILEPVKFNGYNPSFLISIILTAVCLLVLGGFKGKLTESSIIKSALFVAFNGAAAAAASYAIGLGLSELVGVHGESAA